MKTEIIFTSILIILIGLAACQDKDLSTEQMPPIIDNTLQLSRSILERRIVLDSISVNTEGTLVFDTETAYLAITDTLLHFTDDELDRWEESIGFNSLRKKLNEIYNQVYAINNIDSFPNLVKKNADYIELEHGFITPIVKAKFYRNILNEKNYFYIGNDKYEVLDGTSVRITTIEGKNSNIPQPITFSYCKPNRSSNVSTLSSSKFPRPPYYYPEGLESDYEATGNKGAAMCSYGSVQYHLAPYWLDNYLIIKYNVTRNITKKEEHLWVICYYLDLDMFSYCIRDDKWMYYINKDQHLECKEINALLVQSPVGLVGWKCGYEIRNESGYAWGSPNTEYHFSHSYPFIYYGSTPHVDWCSYSSIPPLHSMTNFSMKGRIYPNTYCIAFGYNTTMPSTTY